MMKKAETNNSKVVNSSEDWWSVDYNCDDGGDCDVWFTYFNARFIMYYKLNQLIDPSSIMFYELFNLHQNVPMCPNRDALRMKNEQILEKKCEIFFPFHSFREMIVK